MLLVVTDSVDMLIAGEALPGLGTMGIFTACGIATNSVVQTTVRLRSGSNPSVSAKSGDKAP